MHTISPDAISLCLPEDLPIEDWRAIGAQLARESGRMNWLIGDWWAYGEAGYGERKAMVAVDDWSGPAFQTCMNLATVARAFEPSRRRGVLSFSHHAEVAYLPRGIADELLDWCLKDEDGRRRSVRELRERVREYQVAVMTKAAERASARNLATATPITLHIVREEPAERRFFTIRPPAPEVLLDTSAADGTVPDDLSNLRPEPGPLPVAVDHVEIARHALSNLPVEQRIEVLTACAAEIGFRLEPL
ncbi:MAG TPA: hypothetical protein VHT00_01280 [Stellaceae bacterium]|jgi:hypothetical protein|nr:hypothetical protein [Stellaceae bacterium]